MDIHAVTWTLAGSRERPTRPRLGIRPAAPAAAATFAILTLILAVVAVVAMVLRFGH